MLQDDARFQDYVSWFDASQLVHGLLAPLRYALEPSSRLFWVFWASSAVLAIAALYLQWRSQPRRVGFRQHVVQAFFSPRYWFNRSTLTDVGYMLGNSVLRVMILVPLLGSHLVATLWVARLLQSNLGNAPTIELPWLVIAGLYTLVFFVLEDLSRFSLHMTMHRVPWLWRLHRLHHSASTLTPLTLHRVHPLEMSLYYLRGMAVFGLVSGVFVYLFGRQLSGLDVLGVDLLGFAFNFFGANLRHSHIWLSFGPLERWLISPAQHQIHHSSAPEHRDRNFGTCLALWDRLLGTSVPAGTRKQRLKFGVG
jgi:sterol desaturase/sphingolipid hydroxylase (fatty acid hydroxylase superfamily)